MPPTHVDIAELRETQQAQGERLAVLEGTVGSHGTRLGELAGRVESVRLELAQQLRDVLQPLYRLLYLQLAVLVLAIAIIGGTRLYMEYEGNRVQVHPPGQVTEGS